MSTADESESNPRLTYRERNVDDELDDHESRISRLEKAFLIGVGYVLADQDVLLEPLIGLIL